MGKRGGFRCALTGCCGHGGAGGGLTRSGGILCDWLGEHIWLSLTGPKLEMGIKIRKLSVINQALDVSGPLLRGYAWLPGWLRQITVGFLGWLFQVAGQRSAFIHGLAIVRLYIQSLTDYPTHVPRSGPTPISTCDTWASLMPSFLACKVGTTNTTLQSGCGS